MNRILMMTIFLSVFLSVFFLMHFYVFWRFSQFFSIARNVWFFVVVAVFSLSYILFSALERTFSNVIVRVFYTISSVWVGIIFLLFSAMVVYDILKYIVKLSPFVWGIVILGVVGVVVLYAAIANMFVVVKTVEIPAGVSKEVTLVQLSDVHVGTIRREEFLREIVEKTNALEPDVVLITGDLIDGGAKLEPEEFLPLNEIKAPVFFVTGNHETYEGLENVTKMLSKTNMAVLRDEAKNFGELQIIGIDYSESKNTVAEGLKKVNVSKSKVPVLMYHAPLGFEDAQKSGIKLMLSGHTHAGQIIPFNLLVRLQFRYVHGLFENNGSYLYVSPGTGTWGPPMRLGSFNEITVIRLVKG